MMMFRAEGLPSQCAFVPSARVTLCGVKPSRFANVSYVSVVDGFKYLCSPSRQRSENVATTLNLETTYWLWAIDVRASIVRSAV